jgi:hypothetical protein
MPRQYAFRPASNRGDWSVNFQIVTDAGPAVWDSVDDIVSLAMAYDWVPTQFDYGMRQSSNSPQLVTRSNDGTDQITLIAPGLVAVLIPASVMGQFAPVTLVVTLAYERVSDGRKATIWQGRLPIIEGFV